MINTKQYCNTFSRVNSMCKLHELAIKLHVLSRFSSTSKFRCGYVKYSIALLKIMWWLVTWLKSSNFQHIMKTWTCDAQLVTSLPLYIAAGAQSPTAFIWEGNPIPASGCRYLAQRLRRDPTGRVIRWLLFEKFRGVITSLMIEYRFWHIVNWVLVLISLG